MKRRIAGPKGGLAIDLQFFDPLLNTPYAHKPRKPKQPCAVEDRPFVNLHFAITRAHLAECASRALAGDNGEGFATSVFSDDGVEEEYGRAIHSPFNHVPCLSHAVSRRR